MASPEALLLGTITLSCKSFILFFTQSIYSSSLMFILLCSSGSHAGSFYNKIWYEHKNKRGSLLLLLVPLSEALALPIEVERATQKPTQNMALPNLTNNHIQHWASTVASSLTSI